MALVLYILNCTVLLFTVMQISKSTGHGNEVCSDHLGMENGNIKDSQITVSSAFHLSNSGKSARLNKNLPNWGAWCPNVTNPDKGDFKHDEYIQIDLLGLTTITKVAIQGRERQGGTEFTKTYQISYSYDKRNWMYYREKSSEVKIFAGNTENTRVVKSKIDRPILARYVRIHPGYTYKMQVCLRLELYGCPNEEGILSYSIPQGHTTKDGKIHYKDTIYNGVAKNGILYNGTGLLTDGEIGPGDSKKDRGNGWVGWFNLTYVNITFEFYALKKFSDVTITINIDYTRIHFLFEKSKILFGVREDDLSQSSALQYCPKQVSATKKTINLTLPLCGNVGNFVRMQLYPGGKWLLISEIKFNSDEAHNTEKTFQTCGDSCFLNRPSVPSSAPTSISTPTSTSTSTKCTETSSAHLLYILIALICVFCVIGLVILAVLLTRRKVQPPTRNEEVSLEVRAPSVLNNGNDDVPEASASLSQTPNYEQNQPEEEDQIGDGYEYPSLPESGYVIPVHSAYPAPGYTSLVRTPAPENDHQYQKLLKSSREPPSTT